MDSSESRVHGEQEGSAYNGHFESRDEVIWIGTDVAEFKKDTIEI